MPQLSPPTPAETGPDVPRIDDAEGPFETPELAARWTEAFGFELADPVLAGVPFN